MTENVRQLVQCPSWMLLSSAIARCKFRVCHGERPFPFLQSFRTAGSFPCLSTRRKYRCQCISATQSRSRLRCNDGKHICRAYIPLIHRRCGKVLCMWCKGKTVKGLGLSSASLGRDARFLHVDDFGFLHASNSALRMANSQIAFGVMRIPSEPSAHLASFATDCKWLRYDRY
jgi:hypothetical protein